MTALTKRYDILYLFDVQNGNPNGDPDNDNSPRMNSLGKGEVTDVCIKRKLRNYIELTRDEAGYEIFVKDGSVLNETIKEALQAVEVATEKPLVKKTKVDATAKKKAAQDLLCSKFYDIRAFGGVLSTGTGEEKGGAGSVRGPLQFTFSESLDAIDVEEHLLTRCAVTNIKDVDKGRTFGRKSSVRYALYKGFGFVNANLANKTGFSREDLHYTLQGLMNMFEGDRAAARGLMSTRKVVVFEHPNEFGCGESAADLFDRVSVTLREGVTEPSSFKDYVLALNTSNMPSGLRIYDTNMDGTLTDIGAEAAA